jgi:uncharacterized protein (TIGR03083 family)
MADSQVSPWRVDLDSFDLGEHYRLTRERLTALVGEIATSEEPAKVPVPACPGWSVHDVIAHLMAVVEDVLAGKLTGPPSDDMTAEQVARRQGKPTADMLDEWTEMAPTLEGLLTQVRVWPGFLDVLAHEHDIRGAVNRPEGRQSEEMCAASEWLMSNWEPAVPLLVKIEDRQYPLSVSEDAAPAAGGGPGDLCLTTSSFEVFRCRLGRRSPDQIRQLAWEGDPSPVLDRVALFGPEPYDITE